MTASPHDRLRELFDQAMALPAPRRAAFVASQCRGEAPLQRRLEALLAAAEDQGFLAEPTVGDAAAGADRAGAAAATGEGPAVLAELREGPGTRIGPYKLLQQIGEGGFGVVFMAEQEQPVVRKVALKIIKVGMDTRQVVARFEQERQALAMMDHPNIAKVLDAGATATGRPFFVMELCKGDGLVDYCDKNNLTIDERLELMAQVCNAVQHAHGKGIIHRDLKPSNILVGTQDGKPSAKVIDFGIAKATSQKLTDKTLFTEHQQVIGTLQYMSPEQAEGSLDIDTRTDVYSLGVLLYELLTGSTPFDKKTMQNAMYGEIQRMIREVEPNKPSTRLSESQDRLASIAAHRRIEPKRLGLIVRGELDWIVMKALEKDRSRRYETANGLAMDLRRYLGGEDVVAAPPSSAYRLRKFVRRHRGQVAAAAAVLLTLLVGIVGTGYGLVQARAAAREERAAKAAAERNLEFARQGHGILGAVFTGLDPQQGPATVGELRSALRDNLLQAQRALEQAAVGDPLELARLQATLARSLLALGEPGLALPLFTGVRAVHAERLGADHPDTLAATANLGLCLADTGQLEPALTWLQQALARREATLGADHPDTLGSLANLASILLAAGRLEQALPLFERSLARSRAVLGEAAAETIQAMHNLAAAHHAAGRVAMAVPLFEQVARLQEQQHGAEHPSTLKTLNSLAVAYQRDGKLAAALPLLERTLSIRRTRLGADHPDTLSSLNNLASAYQADGKVARAVPLLEEARRVLLAKFGVQHPDTLKTTGNLANCYRELGKLEPALPLLEETLAHQQATLGADHPDTQNGIANLGAAWFSLRRFDKSVPLFEALLQAQEAKLGREHPSTQATVMNLGANYKAVGRFADALPLLEEGWRGAEQQPHLRGFGDDLLETRWRAGERAAATALLQELLAGARASTQPGTRELATQLTRLVRPLLEAGAGAEAEPLARENLALREALQPDSWATCNARSQLGEALLLQQKYADAEPLLVAGYEGLQQREAKLPATARPRLVEALQRLVRLCTATQRPEQAAQWQALLDAAQQPAAPAAK
jgi:serine/threonine protein kinase/tetratricopeptide (TPR) repeat protein